MTSKPSNLSAIVIGAGLSGLAAARSLVRSGWKVTVLEAQDTIGGRVQTDKVDGFLLDRGFQVYLTAYETAGHELDLPGLELRCFPPGAWIQYQGHRYQVGDPMRCSLGQVFTQAIRTALAPIGSIRDKLAVLRFGALVSQRSEDQLFSDARVNALDRLRQFGFSETIIDRFFRPFFGGIFLDRDLDIASDRLDFVFRSFRLGYAALPKNGMAAIPTQFAKDLPEGTIRTKTTVQEVGDRCVQLASGEWLRADAVIVATEQPAAHRILKLDTENDIPCNSTACLYFAVKYPPIKDSMLVLNADGTGPINNLCFPSFCQPSYAPPGEALLSVSTIGITKQTGPELIQKVRNQLIDWFGAQANEWRHLRTYLVPYALPKQSCDAISLTPQSRVSTGVYRCGDYCKTGSIEGAIQSGLEVAKMISLDFDTSNTAPRTA
jgi:phytoene dehydrogenase-like protein